MPLPSQEPTAVQLQILRQRYPGIGEPALKRNWALLLTPNETHAHRPLPDPKPQRHKAPALGDSIQGKAESFPRVTVRFTGYRVRPLDPDNFAGSVKDLLDGLRHAALISGDEPWRIRLETEQVKVRTVKEERTEIEIDYEDESDPVRERHPGGPKLAGAVGRDDFNRSPRSPDSGGIQTPLQSQPQEARGLPDRDSNNARRNR